MSRDRRVLDIMDATQARYTTALAELRRRAHNGSLSEYMRAVDRVLEADDQSDDNMTDRCVRCLRPIPHATVCQGEPETV